MTNSPYNADLRGAEFAHFDALPRSIRDEINNGTLTVPTDKLHLMTRHVALHGEARVLDALRRAATSTEQEPY